MPIGFTEERWIDVRETYRKWWAGELKRPVCGAVVIDRDPGRPVPSAPLLTQATCHDFSWSVEDIVERLDYELCRQSYLGDAFPYVNLDCFGPGVAAAFLGAKLDNTTGGVWFEPFNEKPVSQLHFEYDGANPWLLRVKDLCRAAVDRWGNSVVVGMPDLGGTLDILQIFRPGEKLLFDFYDFPEEVKRAVWEIHQLWHRFFAEIHEILQQKGMGYSDWSGIYSEKPFYIFQCDVSYMISPEIFNEFALPELEASINRLERSVYHLDGPGALNHIDMILGIENLSCMQWIPGDGNPSWGKWPRVYQKIAASGKLIQSMGSPIDDLIKIIAQTGVTGRIQHSTIIFEKADVKEPQIVENRVLISSSLLSALRLFFSFFKPIMAFLRVVYKIKKPIS